MTHRFIALSTLIASLALPAVALAEDLVFIATDLESDRGQVLCTLYDSSSTWLEDSGYVDTVVARPVAGEAVCIFEDVEPGTYAVFFMHDANGNSDMDTNALGLPTEEWGCSNDARARLGAPSYRRARFTHPSLDPPTGRAH